jgi:hypothetical protein
MLSFRMGKSVSFEVASGFIAILTQRYILLRRIVRRQDVACFRLLRAAVEKRERDVRLLQQGPQEVLEKSIKRVLVRSRTRLSARAASCSRLSDRRLSCWSSGETLDLQWWLCGGQYHSFHACRLAHNRCRSDLFDHHCRAPVGRQPVYPACLA